MSGSKMVVIFALWASAGLLGAALPDAGVSPPAGSSHADLVPSVSAAVALPTFTLHHCGDPCLDPGQTGACLDDSGEFLALVACSCEGGGWAC